MTQFSWLHLTDLHMGKKEGDWLWPSVREVFFEDLERIHSESGPWDLVLFTGDVAQTGDARQFERADQLLEQLWKKLQSFGSGKAKLSMILS